MTQRKHDPLKPNRKLSTAPMMEWSDRYCRVMWRKLSQHTLLYTEMVTTGAIIHGHRQRFLDFFEREQPVALQLGGCDPTDLATCAKIGADWGYDEINLNVGCPSDRVQKGMIGAVLMKHASLVKDSLSAMNNACEVPVTVKHRIGVDEYDSYEFLRDFVGEVAQSGVDVFIVHARKAFLKSLNPKENREVPPLDYERVFRLKQDFPDLDIIVNGGITHSDDYAPFFERLDGVMIGRAAYQNPMILADADQKVFNDTNAPVLTARQLVESLLPFFEEQVGEGVPLRFMSKHLMGLFQAVPGARQFRRHITETVGRGSNDVDVIRQALQMVKDV